MSVCELTVCELTVCDFQTAQLNTDSDVQKKQQKKLHCHTPAYKVNTHREDWAAKSWHSL